MTHHLHVVDDDYPHDPMGGEWQQHSACRGVDPELFYPERGETTSEAKTICVSCPVRVQCLEYAITNGERFGVWGGLSERERRHVRKMRAEGVITPLPQVNLTRKASKPRPRPRGTPVCGTYSGYKAHGRANETPCADCRRANALYRVDWLARQRKGETG